MAKRISVTIMLIAIMTLLCSTSVYAKGRCGYKGKCEASTDNCNNGTVYCDRHAAAYMQEKGHKYCSYSGCKVVVGKTAGYCSKHKCRKNNCTNKVIEGTNYCTIHTSGKSTTSSTTKNSTTSKKSTTSSKTTTKSSSACLKSGCNNKKVSGGFYCTKHTCQKSGCYKYTGDTTAYCSSHKSSKSSSSKNTTKKVTMPDCDDYDSYDDFMDDWDGSMPDGSDAEDYWENW